MRRTRWIVVAAMCAAAVAIARPGSAGKPNLLDDFGGMRWRTIGWAPTRWSPTQTPVDWGGFLLGPTNGLPEPGFGDDVDYPPLAPPDIKAFTAKRDPPPPQTVRYLEFYAGKSKNSGYAYHPIARPLWAPFQWETTTGLPNAKHVAGVDQSARFGTQLVGEDAATNGWSLMAKRTDMGIDVEAADDQSGTFGTASFANATAVDLSIAADGTTIFFYARKFADATWTKVAERPFVQTVALFPALSAYAVHSGGQVAFDRWRVVGTAPPPGTLTPAGQALALVYRAHDWQLDELHRIDAAPDLTHVRVGVAGAVDFLNQAVALVAGGQKKKINAAKAQAAAALKLIDRNKPRASIVATLKRALAADLAARKALAGK